MLFSGHAFRDLSFQLDLESTGFQLPSPSLPSFEFYNTLQLPGIVCADFRVSPRNSESVGLDGALP